MNLCSFLAIIRYVTCKIVSFCLCFNFLIPVVRPKILPFSFGDMPSNAGNTVQVACTVAEGDKPLRISWNFYSEGLSSDMGVSTMPVGDSMNILFISSVAPSNRGNYTCVANNPAGHDSYTSQLLVNGIQQKSRCFLPHLD